MCVAYTCIGAVVGHAQVAGTSRYILLGRPEETGLYEDDGSHVS